VLIATEPTAARNADVYQCAKWSYLFRIIDEYGITQLPPEVTVIMLAARPGRRRRTSRFVSAFDGNIRQDRTGTLNLLTPAFVVHWPLATSTVGALRTNFGETA
jgi:hypothetical protein